MGAQEHTTTNKQIALVVYAHGVWAVMTPRIRTTFTTDYNTHAYLKQTKHCIVRHKHLTLSRPNKQELLFMDGKDNLGPRFSIKEGTISCNWVYIGSHCADRFSLHILVYLFCSFQLSHMFR